MSVPVEPTCPIIDDLLEKLEQTKSLVTNFEDIAFGGVSIIADEIYILMQESINLTEELRTANTALRKWGEKLEAKND